MMSEMDGFAVLDAIRMRDNGRNVPVLAVTARAMKGEKESILARGFNGYISKPVDETELISMIQTCFGKGDRDE